MRDMVALGALMAFLGVALGAFGAHGLSRRVDSESMKTFNTGVQYHLVHALAMVLAGSLVVPGAALAGWFFLAGIVLFSGSLYGLTVKRLPRALGIVTPLGGLGFLIGWAWVFVQALR